jgi:hypothetical protein
MVPDFVQDCGRRYLCCVRLRTNEAKLDLFILLLPYSEKDTSNDQNKEGNVLSAFLTLSFFAFNQIFTILLFE